MDQIKRRDAGIAYIADKEDIPCIRLELGKSG